MLIEFALVSFTLYVLMVVLLDLGRGSLATQTLQSAADVFAQELARAPLDATVDFEEALQDPYVTERIFDEQFLVIVLEGDHQTPEELDSYFAGLPIVNQILRPLMFRDTIPTDPPQVVLRYPGALMQTASGYSVLIPRVLSRQWGGGNDGVETIDWIRVVEEVLEDDPSAVSHFPITSSSSFAGLVNLRINYPFQASAMSAFDPSAFPSGPASIVVANDALVGADSPPAGFEYLDDPAGGVPSSPYAGKYGLGYHYAFLKKVRPYRKVISIHSVARREVIFGP